MKRLISIFSVVAVLLAGCTQFDDLEQPIVGGEQNADTSQFIYAGFAEETSRTYVENDTDILWQNGDALSLFYSNCRNIKFEYNGEDGARMAKFDFIYGTGNFNDKTLKIIRTHALYPYDEMASIVYDDNRTTFDILTTFPAVQNYVPNSFGRGANIMVAAAKSSSNELRDENVYFRNAGGFITFKLYGEGVKVKSLKLVAHNNKKIAGRASIRTYYDKDPVVTMADDAVSEITLNCGAEGVALGANKESATEFWFALPPTTFEEGFKIEVTDTNGYLFRLYTSKSVEVKRNMIKPMAAFRFNTEAPADNQIFYYCDEGYTTPITFYGGDNPFDAKVVDHYYDPVYKRFVIEFDTVLKVIKYQAFCHYAHNDTHHMRRILLPKSLTTIEEQAFWNTELVSIVIPGAVNHIGHRAFESCDYLRSLTFEPSPTNTPLEIGYARTGALDENRIAPFGNSPLREINVNRNFSDNLFKPTNHNEGILASAHGYASYPTIVIGEQMTEIKDYMFGTQLMRSITIPDSITKIGTGAFSGCYCLESISIPESVQSIGYNAFYGCSALNELRIEDSDTPLTIGYNYGTFDDEHGPFYDSPLSYIYCGRDIAQVDDDGNPSLADSWEEGVFAYDFYNQSGLVTSLNIGPKVTKITNYMFSGVRVQSVYIYPAIKEIGEGAFYDCRIFTGLSCNHITPPTLGNKAFERCEKMYFIKVPEEAIDTFKSAPNWSAFDRVGSDGKNFYRPID